MKLRSRRDFDVEYDEIKDLMAAQTLFNVDDAIESLDKVTVKVMDRREELRAKAVR